MNENEQKPERVLARERAGKRFIHEVYVPADKHSKGGNKQTGLPGVVLFPNFMGPSDSARRHAVMVAEAGYAVMLADIYGEDVRPANREEAVEAMGALKADPGELRARAADALATLREQSDLDVDSNRMAAIGFCFGGAVALELARTGADLQAAVSFHGALATRAPASEGDIRASILVLHGADDPAVPQSQVADFVGEMQQARVEDWQLVQFGGTVHSFTEPGADVPGRNQYHPRSSARAFALMHALFDEVF